MDEPKLKLRIAIIGGGLAGATLANALIRHSHLDIKVFESAPEFSERGAAVGLSINAQLAMGQIFHSAEEVLSRAEAVPMNSLRMVTASGPMAGTRIFDFAEEKPGVVVHRASLLRELLAPLPPTILYANKRLSSIDDRSSEDGGIHLKFEDGTLESFDAVIGADGIFGSVRKHVLRDSSEADSCAALPAGFWDCRNLVSMDRARQVLGAQYFEDYRQYGWVGDGAFFMHDVLDGGKTVQCVIAAVETGFSKERKMSLTRENLEKMLEPCLNGPITAGMITLLLEQENLKGYSQWEHKQTATYANGQVCVIGDAAHATSPWQGSGAGMAIEDAMILSALLENVLEIQHLDYAFRAYDMVRRPRCQRIIDSSRDVGRIFCGKHIDAGLDPKKLAEVLSTRWDFIYALDMNEHRTEALKIFGQLQAGKNGSVNTR